MSICVPKVLIYPVSEETQWKQNILLPSGNQEVPFCTGLRHKLGVWAALHLPKARHADKIPDNRPCAWKEMSFRALSDMHVTPSSSILCPLDTRA